MLVEEGERVQRNHQPHKRHRWSQEVTALPIQPHALLESSFLSKGVCSPSDSPINSPRHQRCFSIDDLKNLQSTAGGDDNFKDEYEQQPLSPSFYSRVCKSPSIGASPLIFTVGEYHIVRRLGKGAAGTVYLAHHATKAATQPPVVRDTRPSFSSFFL